MDSREQKQLGPSLPPRAIHCASKWSRDKLVAPGLPLQSVPSLRESQIHTNLIFPPPLLNSHDRVGVCELCVQAQMDRKLGPPSCHISPSYHISLCHHSQAGEASLPTPSDLVAIGIISQAVEGARQLETLHKTRGHRQDNWYHIKYLCEMAVLLGIYRSSVAIPTRPPIFPCLWSKGGFTVGFTCIPNFWSFCACTHRQNRVIHWQLFFLTAGGQALFHGTPP